MGKKTVLLMPKTEEILKTMGENIRIARLRRNLSMRLVCERASISRATLWQVEKGSPNVAIGIYAAVLHALDGGDKELLKVMREDELGKIIQDLNLTTPKRGKR